MDEDLNPLELTLDEVIQLNKLRNQQAEQPCTSEANVKEEQNGFEVLTSSIQTNLRENQSNGYRPPVHTRLGWKSHSKGITPVRNQALRLVRSAQNQVFKRPLPQKVLKNMKTRGMFTTKLTPSALQRHNQLAGNFTVRRRNGGGSMFSMSTGRQSFRPPAFRHSMKKCLDPEIQQLIQEMLNDEVPATVQNGARRLPVDFSLLQHYRPPVDATKIPIHIRIVMND